MISMKTTAIAGCVLGLVLGGCGGEKPPTPPPAPLAAAPEPEKITVDNAAAAADALEKEIATDGD
jgi:hypothetical protein